VRGGAVDVQGNGVIGSGWRFSRNPEDSHIQGKPRDSLIQKYS
jgi:hypothetical protein